MVELMAFQILLFQSTLPRRERPTLGLLLERTKQFQSTLPRRERRRALQRLAQSHPDFNPRSREGSDELAAYGEYEELISIHAPAKGATDMYRQ